MSRVSESLREFVNTRERHLYTVDRSSLLYLAGRIDAEMVELPKGKDGKPIRVEDTLYDSDCTQWTVTHIDYYSPDDGPDVVAQHGNAEINFEPSDYHGMTHERPDSWSCVADELERYANDSCGEDEIDGATASTLVDFAQRIRKLAEREDANGTD